MHQKLNSSTSWKKLAIVILLVIFLQYPISQIMELTEERHQRYNDLVEDSEHISETASIYEPLLIVPLDLEQKSPLTQNNPVLTEGALPQATPSPTPLPNPYPRYQKYIYLRPEMSRMQGNLSRTTLKKSIYAYSKIDAALSVKAEFLPEKLNQNYSNLDWNAAKIIFGSNHENQLAIRNTSLRIDESSIPAFVGASSKRYPGAGSTREITWDTDTPIIKPQKITFTGDIEATAGSALHFYPNANDSIITLSSAFNNPSFIGSLRPTTRELKDSGFTALYTSSDRQGVPEYWDSANPYFFSAYAGIAQVKEIDDYRMIYRVLRYQVLFLVVTFLTLLCFEMLSPEQVHVIQYGLVGAALCIFYLLLISLSEHIGFIPAYSIAALTTSSMIGLYSSAIFNGWKYASVLFGMITGSYAFLLALLQEGDNALLYGSLGLSVLLSIAMYLTRNLGRFTFIENSSNEIS